MRSDNRRARLGRRFVAVAVPVIALALWVAPNASAAKLKGKYQVLLHMNVSATAAASQGDTIPIDFSGTVVTSGSLGKFNDNYPQLSRTQAKEMRKNCISDLPIASGVRN